MCTYVTSFTFNFTLWIGTIIFEPHTSRELLKKVKKVTKQWNPGDSLCRLCKVSVQNVDFLERIT